MEHKGVTGKKNIGRVESRRNFLFHPIRRSMRCKKKKLNKLESKQPSRTARDWVSSLPGSLRHRKAAEPASVTTAATHPELGASHARHHIQRTRDRGIEGSSLSFGAKSVMN